MLFPTYRARRLRRNETLRRMVRETNLGISDFIYPLFAVPGKGVRNPVRSMPGVFQLSVDELAKEATELRNLGIPATLVFGVPEAKDEMGSGAYAPDGIVQQAVQELKQKVSDLLVVTDVCMCEYTSHGHCGVINEGDVDNDATLELLARTARSHAEAGADMVAPSDMMDGRVAVIRETLDEEGFSHLPIMAYAAKYASSFYGPFRDAAHSTPQFGDRRSYQMDPANSDEAIREISLDVSEGADIIMVKPALAYLDVIQRVKTEFDLPLAAYNVSGEYSMIKAAADKGWLDGQRVMMEVLTGIKRAGADIIITYFAKEAARELSKSGRSH
ncbi:MAG: porphobilinogen synthase [Deltaproteobacteria bacterium]|nr:MAG: porphobilinogen synthase [Deltaproteobacteria bacterium]